MGVDAVITWVDGDDPAHRRRLDAHLASIGGPRPRAAGAARFNDAGEIEYCIASILHHAPWFDRIHVVVDRQAPALMRRIAGTPLADRIRLVEHAAIFQGYEHALPTFNSRSIITALWRIPGLSDDFVYFNDDFMLLREVSPTDFFRDGKVVMRGHWRKQSAYRWTRRVADLLKSLVPHKGEAVAGAHLSQELSARLAGFEREYLRMFHNPYPMRRSTLQRFFGAHPAMFEANIRHRLRSPSQFKTECLAGHLELASGQAVVDNRLHTVQLKPGVQSSARLRRKLAQADRDDRVAFACVQSVERASEPVRRDLLAWLDRRVGGLEAQQRS